MVTGAPGAFFDHTCMSCGSRCSQNPLQTRRQMTWDVETESEARKSFHKRLEEFMDYIAANLTAIPNYADRHRHNEPIATGFTESAVNQVSKRMVKKQQMRWTQRGAHLLLQASYTGFVVGPPVSSSVSQSEHPVTPRDVTGGGDAGDDGAVSRLRPSGLFFKI